MQMEQVADIYDINYAIKVSFLMTLNHFI